MQRVVIARRAREIANQRGAQSHFRTKTFPFADVTHQASLSEAARCTSSTKLYSLCLAVRKIPLDQRHEIVLADTLQDEEGDRRLTAIGDQVRPARLNGIGLAWR